MREGYHERMYQGVRFPLRLQIKFFELRGCKQIGKVASLYREGQTIGVHLYCRKVGDSDLQVRNYLS